MKTLTKALERVKAQIRARVEHPFHVVKNLFHFKKTRYKVLAKNTAMLFSLFGLANLVIATQVRHFQSRAGKFSQLMVC